MKVRPEQCRAEHELPGPADFAEQAKLLPAILEAVVEVRELIAGRRKDLLTIEEVAEATGRSAYTVRQWVKQKRVNAIRVSGTGPRGRLLVPRDELRKLIDSGRGSQIDSLRVD
jgi:excisionase family DNA binding protein